jgi:hypothetical protein
MRLDKRPPALGHTKPGSLVLCRRGPLGLSLGILGLLSEKVLSILHFRTLRP